MKHLKMLGLFAMAAAALMALAEGASSQTLTAPRGTAYHGTFSSSLEGSALLKAGFAEITCLSSTVAGEIVATAKETQELKEGKRTSFANNNNTEASGLITAVSFSNCKEGQTVTTTNSSGTLTILKSTRSVSGTGVEVDVAAGGVTCTYGLGATSNPLGTATNTEIETSVGVKEDRVTLAINAKLPKLNGGFLCAAPATWTASYNATSPAGSFLD
jgi:hypothetical protein